MKEADVMVGQEYLAKVSGTLQRVRVTRVYKRLVYSPSRFGNLRSVTHWDAKNLATGRTITIKSAQRLRREVARG